MTIEHPNYWLAYLSDHPDCAHEITAVAPEVLNLERFSPNACAFLAAVEGFRVANPQQRVVFAAAVTRWLDRAMGTPWGKLGIDFFDALAELDHHAPALLIEASPIALAVVSSAADHLSLASGNGIEDGASHIDPCRAAILDTLERDWPGYIRSVLGSP